MDFTEQVADFRDYFPEFNDTEKLSDEEIEQALKKACIYFNNYRWGQYDDYCKEDGYSFLQQGLFNLVAHAILMANIAQNAIEAGKVPSARRGTDSTTVGDTSIVFGSQIMLKLNPWDDALASTPYGTEYLRLRRIASQGGATTSGFSNTNILR